MSGQKATLSMQFLEDRGRCVTSLLLDELGRRGVKPLREEYDTPNLFRITTSQTTFGTRSIQS